MLRKITKRLNYANVMATLAMFCVLGGGAFAAAKLKKDSVGTKQIKANAVKTGELADGAVTTPKLADNAVTGAKADESSFGQVPAAANAANATNAEHATNATNAQNAATAQNATLADNATQFGGRTVTQIRGRGDHSGNSTQNTLDAAFEQVNTEPTSIPTGGGTLVVSASIEASNLVGGGATDSLTCELRDDEGAISQQYSEVIEDTQTVTISAVGFDTYANGTGLANPQDIGLFCLGSTANQIRYENSDIGIVVSPTGA